MRACAFAEMSKVMLPRRGWGNFDILSSETLFDVNSGFMKERELVCCSAHQCDCSGRQSWDTNYIELASLSHLLCLQDHSRHRGQAAFPSPSMSDVFETHFDDASTCDITVKAGEIKIHAHKIVLIAQSALFRAMFQVKKALCQCLLQML